MADRYWPGVTVAATVATVSVMPGFTIGALSPWLERELNVSRTMVGLAMSVFYVATALGSPVTKRLAARLPVPLVLSISSTLASLVLIVSAHVTGFATLLVVLAIGGLSNGLVQPAAGVLIAATVPARRHSLAAGLLGAALGAATLAPGLLVATVVEPYGWRVALVIAGVLALVPAAFTWLTRTRPVSSPPTTPARVGPVLVLWALAAALSAMGNNAVASYFVQLGTHSGLAATVAGTLLSASALVAIAVRITAGALTDRAPHRNPTVIAAMMLTGAAGLALIAIGTTVTFVLGAVLAFSAGWGWTGLLLATALRLVPTRAEDAGHTVQVGVYTGATVAPFAFAALSSTYGFTTTTLIAACAGVAATVAMAAGTSLGWPPGRRQRVDRGRGSPPGTDQNLPV